MTGFVLRPVVKNNPREGPASFSSRYPLITSPATISRLQLHHLWTICTESCRGGIFPPIHPTAARLYVLVISDVTTFVIQVRCFTSTPSAFTAGKRFNVPPFVSRVVAVVYKLVQTRALLSSGRVSYSSGSSSSSFLTLFFVFLVVYVHHRVTDKERPHPIRQDPSFIVIWLVYFSSVFILVC